MKLPALAIVQARMGSKRLPGKVMMEIDGKPLVRIVWEAAIDLLGASNVVVAIPGTAENDVLSSYLDSIGARAFRWDGAEDDLLGRFYAAATTYRWHPDTVILRVTADDPYKDVGMMRRVLNGERLAVEFGGEAFTLGMLQAKYAAGPSDREHLTTIMFDTPPPLPPAGRVWSIDTQEDLDAVRAEWRT